jgi:transcriptional regulator with XRE-family HTH domain
VSQKDLAERLDVSEARVSQIFSPSSNPTLVLLAKIFHALGDKCALRVVEAGRQRAPKAEWVAQETVTASHDKATTATRGKRTAKLQRERRPRVKERYASPESLDVALSAA